MFLFMVTSREQTKKKRTSGAKATEFHFQRIISFEPGNLVFRVYGHTAGVIASDFGRGPRRGEDMEPYEIAYWLHDLAY